LRLTPRTTVERYRGFDVEVIPPETVGTLGRQVICSAIVYEGEAFLFSVSAGVSYTLSAMRGASSEELARQFAVRHAHGLIDLGRYERGMEYELTFGENWDPAAADSATSEEAIRREVLEAAERMLRSEASSSEIPFLVVDGWLKSWKFAPPGSGNSSC
jgi:hypothetical protein